MNDMIGNQNEMPFEILSKISKYGENTSNIVVHSVKLRANHPNQVSEGLSLIFCNWSTATFSNTVK